MVKLANQGPLLFFYLFARGYIDVDTDHPFWVSLLIVSNELAGFDPPNFATAINSVLGGVFASAFTVRLIPHRL
jgi:hypothetical protein